MPGEFRATVRIPKKDYTYLQKLIKEGEFYSLPEAIRAAIREFITRRESNIIERLGKI